MVPFRTAEVPGTIIIDGNQHFLYLVQPGGQAIRYGIGVGREGFGWRASFGWGARPSGRPGRRRPRWSRAIRTRQNGQAACRAGLTIR